MLISQKDFDENNRWFLSHINWMLDYFNTSHIHPAWQEYFILTSQILQATKEAAKL